MLCPQSLYRLRGRWPTHRSSHPSATSQIGKSVPHSSQLYRDEWAASSCRPLRLDINDSSDSGSVVVEAAPSVELGRCDQSPFYGVSVYVSDYFGPGCFAMDVRVKITVLPELPAIA